MPGSPNFLKIRKMAGQLGEGSPDLNRNVDNIASQLGQVAGAVAGTPMINGVLPQWTRPDLQSDFANVSGYALTGYHKDALGYVHGKGVVSSAAGVAANTRIYQLPLGYRSSETHVFAAPNGAASTPLSVGADGWVTTLRAIAAGAAFGLEFHFLADG